VAHGERHRPNLVRRVLAPGSDATRADLAACPPGDRPATCIVHTVAPEVTGHLDLPGDLHGAIETGLEGATHAGRGTATYAFSGFDQDAYPLLGKTGTVEAGRDRADNAVFVGAGPTPDPAKVAVAYLEHVGFGAEAAAPVVRSLFELASGQQADPCLPAGRDPVPCHPPPGPAPAP
jgi:hypothetical protein